MSIVSKCQLPEETSSASSEDVSSDNPSFMGGLSAHAPSREGADQVCPIDRTAWTVRSWRDMTPAQQRAQRERARAERAETEGSLEWEASRMEAFTPWKGFQAFKAGCSAAQWERHIEACLLFAEEHVGGLEGMDAFIQAVRNRCDQRTRSLGYSDETADLLRIHAEERFALALASSMGREPVEGEDEATAYAEAVKAEAAGVNPDDASISIEE